MISIHLIIQQTGDEDTQTYKQGLFWSDSKIFITYLQGQGNL